MVKRIVIIGGGTHSWVRPHLALSAPAYGTTVFDIANILSFYLDTEEEWTVDEYLTKMAGGESLSNGPHLDKNNQLDTNEDVASLLDNVVADPSVKIVFMPVALCDFDVNAIVSVTDYGLQYDKPGKNLPRLKTSKYGAAAELNLVLRPAGKIIKNIRQERKDIFLIGFKTTTGASEQEQFDAGLNLLKSSSCNLVLANDLTTRSNMVITPEQAKYGITTNRGDAIATLVKMTASRAMGTFTRSTVVDGDIVAWNSPEVPHALRTVVNYCISRGAYKPFQGKTVGHFAAKIGEGKFLTSVRKTNFNDLLLDPSKNGLVKVEAVGDNKVVSYGARPSVGGQSQRIIFANHGDTDCIAHMHCQLKPGSMVPVAEQWRWECGSHQCGENTSNNLQQFDNGIWAVMLEKHGPNIVFSKDIDPGKVIKFIEDNFDLDHQTSELS